MGDSVSFLHLPNCTQNISAVSVASYAAFQVGYGLAGKDHTNLQKVPDLFNKYTEINGNTEAPHSRSRYVAYGFPLAPGFPEGYTAARDSLHLGKALLVMKG